MNFVPKELKLIRWVFFVLFLIGHRNGILRKTYDSERNEKCGVHCFRNVKVHL